MMNENALLKVAINEDNTQTVMQLLEKGVNVNATDKYGETPLMVAITQKNYSMVKLLLEKGAHVNAQNPDRETALIYAAAMTSYDTGIMSELLKHNADVHLKDYNGWTALHYLEDVNEKSLNDLAGLGTLSGLNTPDNVGNTPLMNWVRRGISKKGIELLLKQGVNVNHQNRDGYTALTLAAEQGKKDIVEILIRYQADVNVPNAQGKTAVILAAEHGNKEIVETLLNKINKDMKRKASVNKTIAERMISNRCVTRSE